MQIEINPLGGTAKVTTIEAMIEARQEIDALASFKVEKGDVLYIEMGAEPKSDPRQLSFKFYPALKAFRLPEG